MRNITFEYKRHTEIKYVLLLVGFVRLICLFVLIRNDWFRLEGDIIGYIAAAESFVNEGHFLYDGFRTPGYPLIVALCMLISKERYYVLVYIVQNFLNVLAICAVYQIVYLLNRSKKLACIGGCVAALNFHDVLYANLLLTDSAAQSLTTIAVVFLLLLLKQDISFKRKIIYTFSAALLLSYSVLIRPSLLFLPCAYIIGIVFVELLRKEYRLIVPVVLILSILCYSPVYGWSKRNQKVAGYSGYSTVSAINLYCYNAAAVYAEQNGMSYYEAHTYLSEEKDEIFQQYRQSMDYYEAMRLRAKEIILSGVPAYLERCFVDVLFLEFYPGLLSFESIRADCDAIIEDAKNQGISHALLETRPHSAILLVCLAGDCMLLFLLFLFSMIGAIKLMKKDWITASLLLGTLLYNIAVCCQPVGYGAYARFRLSFSMITVIFAVSAIAAEQNKRGRFQWRIKKA